MSLNMAKLSCSFIFILLIVTPLLASNKTGYCTGDDVNVRSGFGENYREHKILYQLDRNDKVQILREQEGWFQIRAEKHSNMTSEEQWVLGKYISVAALSAVQQAQPIVNKPIENFSKAEKPSLTDLDLLWSMPSSFLGKDIFCFFYIHEVQENDNYYSVMVGDANKLFDMKNPMQFNIRIIKGDVDFVEKIVRCKGRKIILGGQVMKEESAFMSMFYLDVRQLRQ